MRLSRIAGGVTAGALLCAPAALAHQGDPNFESRVERVVPAFSGISARVLNFDDALELRARGRRVLVFGYDGEPYAAIAADGTVRVNVNSPAYYLNRDRWGTAELPASVRKRDGRPRWQVIGRTGRFSWHDHRIHWMAKRLPPQVRDRSQRTLVFRWRVPVAVDGRRAAIVGALWWRGRAGGGPPAWALPALVAVAGAGTLAVVAKRRRRARLRPRRAQAW